MTKQQGGEVNAIINDCGQGVSIISVQLEKIGWKEWENLNDSHEVPLSRDSLKWKYTYRLYIFKENIQATNFKESKIEQ